MDMQSYIAETLNELNMTDSNPTASPCSTCKAHEMHPEGERDRAEMEKKPVRSAIGRLAPEAISRWCVLGTPTGAV
jgi:hypothetical protein